MIIQCEQCRTRFKLDDAKVKDKGVKVRCAKCRNVFMVSKEQQPAEKPDFAAMLEQSADTTIVSATPVAFEIEHEPAVETTAGFDFDTSSFALDENSEKPLSSGAEAFELPQDEAAASAETFDVSSLAWNDETAIPVDESAAGNVKIDFSEMAGDGIAQDADKTIVASSSFTDIEDKSAFDEHTEQVKPDLGGFIDSIESHEPVDPDMSKNAVVDETFNLGEIDFGDDLATQPGHQINPEKLDDDHDLLFVPLDEPQDKAVKESAISETPVSISSDSFSKTPEEPAQEELPPLSISSRRKSSSTLMYLLGAVIVVFIAIFAFFGLDKSSEEKAKPLEEASKIVLRGVNASFVNNKAVGEMLVITGEAVNNYDTPRAAIQVMGIIYGEGNKVLINKNAYAGNPLTKEQLAVMPAEKIEATMANQFGDSLANMEILPGKALPFVVVITKVPAEAKEFGLNLVGSTGAAAKK